MAGNNYDGEKNKKDCRDEVFNAVRVLEYYRQIKLAPKSMNLRSSIVKLAK